MIPKGMLEREKSLLAGIGSQDLRGAMVAVVDVVVKRRIESRRLQFKVFFGSFDRGRESVCSI